MLQFIPIHSIHLQNLIIIILLIMKSILINAVPTNCVIIINGQTWSSHYAAIYTLACSVLSGLFHVGCGTEGKENRAL